ncbi:unnamed protein product [Schistosoma curassoni]|nr:unnamed protein product [Schistosoma curassoni]
MISERNSFNIYQVRLGIKEIWNSETSNQIAAKYDASLMEIQQKHDPCKFKSLTCQNSFNNNNNNNKCDALMFWQLYTENKLD